MHVLSKVAITLGITLLVVLICPPVTAYADLADQYFSEGINFSKLGQYSDAVASYDKAVFIRPNNADAWLNRGIALDNLYRYSDAVASYDKAIVIRPNDADVWNNRGIALRKLGWYAEAVASYDKALAASPGYVDAWLNRGVALDYLGRYEDAIASYDKALALQPDHATALENRELALSKQSRSNPATIGVVIFFVIIIAGIVFWYTKPRPRSEQKPSEKKPDQFAAEEKRPEEKKLVYGIIPEESKLHTMASLCCVINIHGLSILDESDKVAALLNELSHGDYEHERNVLIVALKDKVPQELLKSQRSAYLRNTSTRNKKRLIFRKRLIENYGIPEDLAQWAVESWVKALGIKR